MNTPRINSEIRAKIVQVVDASGYLGAMPIAQALKLAQDQNTDLIEIVSTSDPPICKIMDFGKFKYEQSKKDKIQKKNQQVIQFKELRFHPNTDTHDIEVKVKKAREFFAKKYSVRLVMIFTGREITHIQLGQDKLNSIIESLKDVAKLDAPPKLENKQIFCVMKGI